MCVQENTAMSRLHLGVKELMGRRDDPNVGVGLSAASSVTKETFNGPILQ